jgi:hypothetical protein
MVAKRIAAYSSRVREERRYVKQNFFAWIRNAALPLLPLAGRSDAGTYTSGEVRCDPLGLGILRQGGQEPAGSRLNYDHVWAGTAYTGECSADLLGPHGFECLILEEVARKPLLSGSSFWIATIPPAALRTGTEFTEA